MADLHVLRVFTDADGGHGNPLGVVLDGGAVPDAERQRVAAELGFSETVFVDDAAAGRIRIYTPAVELPFAGHPTVGTAWLLATIGEPVEALHPPAGAVATWEEEGLRWVRGRPEWIHDIVLDEMASASDVVAATAPPDGIGSWYPWAWIDEAAGLVRSRFLAAGIGIAEDEATGAAAVLLGARVGRPIVITQGRGSQLHARPGPDGTVEVGGRVVFDELRALP